MPIETDKEAILAYGGHDARKAAGWPDYPEYYKPGDDGGHDATDPAPHGSKVPHSIFFYYFRIDRSGKLRVTHYFYDDEKTPISNVETILPYIAEYARNRRWNPANGKEPQLQKNANFKGIEIKRISYFVVFVDELHWDFLKKSGNPIIPFHREKGGIANHANYSFYNAMIHDVDMSGGAQTDVRQALSMLNLLQRKDGTELGYGITGAVETQPFAFDLVLRVMFANADEYDEHGNPLPADPSRLTVIFDPGGNNLGPPDSPP